MSYSEGIGVVPMGRTGRRFEGFKLGTHSAAIHAALRFGKTPMPLEDIIRETEPFARSIADITRRVKSHLRYWKQRKVYVETGQGWVINPGARFDPEWQEVDEARAKEWYQAQC
jgi:hypothetical protein